MDDRRQGQAWGDPQSGPFAGTSDGTGNGQDQTTPLDYGGNGPNASDPNGTPGTANYDPSAADTSGDQAAAPPPDNSGATANNGGDQTPPPSDTSAAPPPTDMADNSPPPSDNTPPPTDTGTTDNSGNGTTGSEDTGGMADGITHVADGLVGDVVDTASGLVSNATDATTGLLDNVVTTAGNLLDGGTGGAGGLVDGAVSAADGLVTQVVDTADGLLTSTLSTVDGLVGNGTDGGTGLLGDIVQTADGLVTDTTDAVGLGGNGLLGDVTGAAGGLGTATGTGGLIDDVAAVAGSPLNGDVSTDTGPNGSDANIIANLTDDGSAANLVDDATGILTSNLSESGLLGGGPIITASALPEGNGIVDNGANATVNDPAQSGPIVDLDAVSDGQNGSSQNLVNLGALDQGGSPNIFANVLSDGDASNANVTGNVIDVGPEGQNLADANVLTSPDQFQFTSLDGTGADTLVGSLTDVSGTTTGDTGLPVVTAPALDLTGDQSIIDVSLNGDAETDHSGILAPLQQAHPLGIV